MKLNEIFINPAAFEEYSDEQIEETADHFRQLPTIRKLPHSLELKRDGETNPFYALLKKDELVGWLKFKETQIAGKDYNVLEFIYIRPKFRKSVAGAYLILHMKDFSQLPIVVGGASTGGGMLFKGGVELIDVLRQRPALFTLSTLDLQTGKKRALPKRLRANSNMTLVVEVLLPPGMNERYALPKPIETETFDERQDWLGDLQGT